MLSARVWERKKHLFHKWYHGKIAEWTYFGKTLMLTSQTLPEQQAKVGG